MTGPAARLWVKLLLVPATPRWADPRKSERSPGRSEQTRSCIARFPTRPTFPRTCSRPRECSASRSPPGHHSTSWASRSKTCDAARCRTGRERGDRGRRRGRGRAPRDPWTLLRPQGHRGRRRTRCVRAVRAHTARHRVGGGIVVPAARSPRCSRNGTRGGPQLPRPQPCSDCGTSCRRSSRSIRIRSASGSARVVPSVPRQSRESSPRPRSPVSHSAGCSDACTACSRGSAHAVLNGSTYAAGRVLARNACDVLRLRRNR